MPANLTPDYKRAEARFRAATTDAERTVALEEMLRVMPRHKGTDHLRAELRRKLSRLREAPGDRGKAGHVDIFHVPRGGAGQVVLLGLPNSGKSALVGALTKAKVHVADFPFATAAPCPGMAHYEDVPLQLVDMPPITADYVAPGQVGTYRNGDLIAVVVDLAADIEEQWGVCLAYLEAKHLLAPAPSAAPDEAAARLARPILCVGTKVDLAGPGLLELLADTMARPLASVEVSAETGQGLDALRRCLFESLRIVRVYARPPGRSVDRTHPFTLPIGATVQDLARLVHRQLADTLKSARVWGPDVHDGQHVHLDHVLQDGDVVELHF